MILNNILKKDVIMHKVWNKKNNIILDPGIGFGKTFNHNFKLLKNLKNLKKWHILFNWT